LLSIAIGVFQARHSHVEAKESYGSQINKDELIEGTIGLAEPMRGGGVVDMIRCLLMSQGAGRFTL
jgi:hypothetical protein